MCILFILKFYINVYIKMIKANLSSTLYLNHVLVIQCKSLYLDPYVVKI